MQSLFPFLLLVLSSIVQALSSSGNRLLVVLEDVDEKPKYTQLWGDLQARGFQISFESPKSETIALFKHGERAYDHLLLLPPKAKAYGPALTPHILLDFVNNEGNILLALTANHATPAAIISLLLEFDIHLPSDRNALVVDHFNYDAISTPEKHDVLLMPRPKTPRPDMKNYFDGEGILAVPRAVGQTLGSASPLLVPILRAPSTAYSYNPKDEANVVEDPFATGKQMAIASALQTRNSARFTVLGSVEMLQDEWFNAKVRTTGKEMVTANKEFSKQITGWTFKELGVLRVGRLQHDLDQGQPPAGSTTISVGAGEHNPEIYRIKNKVTFSIEVSEYEGDRLIPFEPPPTDAIQLEFTMLSPFHRLNLRPVARTSNSTIFSTNFTTPDQHGIFNFRVNYKRPFLTNIDEKRQVTVRHFAHDEWPRSYAISGAWVWIAGIWVTVVGWLGFVALWLWSGPVKEKTVKKMQ